MHKILLASLLTLAGCTNPPVQCAMNAFCALGSTPGVCLASPSSSARWCANADQTCPSTLRWQETAGDGLAGECVGGPAPDMSVPVDMAVVDLEPPPDLTPLPDLTYLPDLYVCGKPNTPCCTAKLGDDGGICDDPQCLTCFQTQFGGWQCLQTC